MVSVRLSKKTNKELFGGSSDHLHRTPEKALEILEELRK